MKVETLDRFAPVLDEIAGRSDRATFYHGSVWIESLAAAYPDLRFRCLVAGGDSPRAYVPYFVTDSGLGRSCWSMPFGTYGGPVGEDEATANLLQAFVDLRRGAGVLELGLVDYGNHVELPEFSGEEAVTHVLDLQPGFESVWHAFEKSKRRQARKAEREGIVVSEATSVDDVIAYHGIYERRSDQWQQRIRYPRALFVELFERGRGRSVRLFLARLDGRIIGGHLNFYFKDSVIAWNGVTEEHERAHQASTALYATCIRHACEVGGRWYNLGGSVGKDTLVSYKESLGAVGHTYRVLRWRSMRGKLAAAVKKRLPRR